MQDLEIYIRDLEPGAVSGWLENHLEELELDEEVELELLLQGGFCSASAIASDNSRS